MGTARRNTDETDPVIRLSHFEAHRIESSDNIEMLRQRMTKIELSWSEFRGGFRVVKWLLGGLTISIIGELAAHIWRGVHV